MRAAGHMAAESGWLIWNQGGSGDDVEEAHPGHVISVLTPTGRYAEPFLPKLASEPGGSGDLCIVQGPGSFGRQAHFVGAYAGPAGVLPDYPAVQAAAGAVIATHCARLADSTSRDDLWTAAAELETSTFFGDFKVDPRSGAQVSTGQFLFAGQAGNWCLQAHRRVDGPGPGGWRAWRLPMTPTWLTGEP
jgi:hypothetical protein